MKFFPPFVALPKLVNVTVEPTVSAITIFGSHLDDLPNETTVAMLIVSVTFFLLIQNLPPLSNDIGIES